MSRGVAIAAALATVLAVTACGPAQQAGAPEAASASEATSSQQAEEGGAGPIAPLGEPEPTGPDAVDAADAAVRRDRGVPGLPAGSGASVDDVLRLGAVATWTDRPTQFAVSLPSSDRCIAVATPPVAVSASTISITFKQPAECGTPDAARTYTITVPEGIDTDRELRLVIDGLPSGFTLTLPAA